MTYTQLIFTVVMGVIVGLILSGVIVFASVPTSSMLIERQISDKVTDIPNTEPIAMTGGLELLMIFTKIILLVALISIIFGLFDYITPPFGEYR